MDSCTSIEHKHLQLNQIEIVYSEGIKMSIFKFQIYNKFLKFFFQNNRILIFYSLKCAKFLKEYLYKIGFFFFPNSQLQCWVFFWMINSLDLIKFQIDKKIKKNLKEKIQKILFRCGQKSKNFLNSTNLVSLYAITLAFFSLNKRSSIIKKSNILKIYSFLRKLNSIENFVRSSLLGECDPRSLFCVLVIGSLFNIFTKVLAKRIISELKIINNIDGGFSCDRSKESHGALGFCLIGTSVFFSNTNSSLKIPSNFKIWFLAKLKVFDFGIQGRLNKITDSCYMFWLGALSIVLSICFPFELLNVMIFCSKLKFKSFCDQVGKKPDLYHTFYSLCGLCLLSFIVFRKKNIQKKNRCFKENLDECKIQTKINPIYGIREAKFFISL